MDQATIFITINLTPPNMEATKKAKILQMFNSVDWFKNYDSQDIKIITGGTFEDFGLYYSVENKKQHCDVIYARRIIQGLGHKVIVGSSFYVWKDKLIKNK